MAEKSSKFKLLPQFTTDIEKIVSAINNDRKILDIPTPSNLTATGGAGYAVLQWDDVANNLRPDVDGAKIWKVAASDDDNTSFYDNNSKAVLVWCSRTTYLVDVMVTAGDYIYWVQWVNLNGDLSGVAGGVTATVS
jgi:hypothetical protein